MYMKPVITAILLTSSLMLGNANYLAVFGQEQAQNTDLQFAYHIQFMAVPQKLIQDTDAAVLIYAADSQEKPLPLKIPNASVTSSDPSVVKIKDVASNEFDNSVKVGIHAGKIGSAIITAAANGFLSSQVTLEVVGDAYKPAGLLVKAVPSSFSHTGPYKGYVSVQLVNFFENPVSADEDVMINLSSSNPNVVSLNQQVKIKKGENFIVKDFMVLGPGIALLEAEVPGKWKETAKVTVSQPKTPLQLQFYVAPQIAPALLGKTIYGFVQLFDADNNPIKAGKDIAVDIISDNIKIRHGAGVIKNGSTQVVVPLAIDSAKDCSTETDLAPKNDNFRPCVELTAVSKGFNTKSVLVELRKPITRSQLNPETRIDDPTTKIEPMIFPISIDPYSSQVNIEPVMHMPLLADGSSQAIGVVQLMTFVDSDFDGKVDLATTQPVVTPLDLHMNVQSGDEFTMQIKETMIRNGYTSALIEANMGYQTGPTTITAVAKFFGEYFAQATVLGHGDVFLAAEPLVSKIMAKTDFPYIVYLKDSSGMSAYSVEDMQLSLSRVDSPEPEIGISRTTTGILTIDSGTIRKGSSTALLKATSMGKGNSTITVEGTMKDALLSTANTMNMSAQLPEKVEFFIPSLILGNAKYTVPLQVLDKDGFPIKTTSEVEILFVPSMRDIVSAPETVSLSKGEYYTTLVIEAKSDGKTEITAQANNFQSSKLDVEVTSPVPKLTLTPSIDLIRMGEKFIVSLNSEFMNLPGRGLQVKWSSNIATLVEADQITDEFGSAEATFVLNQESPLVVKAEVSGPGYRTTEAMLNMQTGAPGGSSAKGIDMLTSSSYFLILPAIGGAIFWLQKTERINLPFGSLLERINPLFDRLLERFRKSED